MKKLFALAILMLVTSCATTYSPYRFGSGYKDEKISDTSYKVTFVGNRYTDQSVIKEFFMRRCSELTVNANYDFFTLQDEKVEKILTEGGFDNAVFDQDIKGNYVVASDPYEYKAESFTHTGTIQMFKAEQHPKDAIDARSIIKKQDEIVAKKKAEKEKEEAEKDPWSNY